jgi:hypothetical protein
MVDFYYKYLKYKTKYLNMSSIIKNDLIGGDKPSYFNIKDIGLFEANTPIDRHLNPIYGFIWTEYSVIENYLNFYNPANKISKFVNKAFHKISRIVKPTIGLNDITLDDLGQLLGYMFIYKILLKPIYDNINRVSENITEIIKILNKNSRSVDMSPVVSSAIVSDNIFKSFDYSKIIIEEVSVDIDLSTITSDVILNRFLKNYFKKIIDYKKSLETHFEPKYSAKAIKPIKKIISPNLNINNNDEELFHVVLAIVWWFANNKSGIREYYLGINKILPESMKVFIPDTFDTDIYEPVELDTPSRDFNLALAIEVQNMRGIIKLYNQEYSSIVHSSISFPDCGETSIRNFINIIVYDTLTKQFNIHVLDRFGPIPDLIKYYEVFNNESLQSSLEKLDIFGGKFNSRDAWSLIVSNLPGVQYKNEYHLKDDTTYYYEIKSGLSIGTDFTVGIGISTEEHMSKPNILQVLINLFSRVKNFDDFNNEHIKLTVELNERGFGQIFIQNKKDNYEWKFLDGHYYIDKNQDKSKLIDIKSITKEEFFIVIRRIEYTRTNAHLLSKIKQDWYYYIDYTPDQLLELFNSGYVITEEDYDAVLKYMYTNYNSDQILRISINFDMVKDYTIITSLNIIKYDYDYNYLFRFLDKLIKLQTLEFLTYNLPFGDSLMNLTNLQTLQLPMYNLPFGDSLTNLTNLQTLEIPIYNLPFGDSLTNLTNLQTLNLPMYRQPLDNSFANLINLHTLKFKRYNHLLGNSLANLTNLQTLELFSYNHPFNDSLINLTNLQTLNLYYYSQPLDDSLANLINLQTLHLPMYNNPFGNSLANLINLQTLKLQIYSQPLDDFLANLINLQTLNLGSYNNPLGNSLAKLINLQTLKLPMYSQSLNDSLAKLINLQTLDLDSYDQPLGNSLANLINLQTLKLPMYGQPLDDSLTKLINLQTLNLDSYNQPLGNSLANLINLQVLYINSYRGKISDSLKNLTNLQEVIIDKINKIREI